MSIAYDVVNEMLTETAAAANRIAAAHPNDWLLSHGEASNRQRLATLVEARNRIMTAEQRALEGRT